MAASKGSGQAPKRSSAVRPFRFRPQWSSRSCSARWTIAGCCKELGRSSATSGSLIAADPALPAGSPDHAAPGCAGRHRRERDLEDGLPRARRGARVAYLQGIAAATLTFEQLLRILVPATQWWKSARRPTQIKNGKGGKIHRGRRCALQSRGLFLSFGEAEKRGQARDQADFTPLHRCCSPAGVLLWISTRKSADPKPTC